jgi:hypothetical protein
VRKTLCHELAHNVWGEHDRRFWDLCKKIEKEVESEADWRVKGGRTLGTAAGVDEFYNPEEWENVGRRQDETGDMVADHGGWTGGEFVLGGGSSPASGLGPATTGAATGLGTGSMSRRELMAKAAEERMKTGKSDDGNHAEKENGT